MAIDTVDNPAHELLSTFPTELNFVSSPETILLTLGNLTTEEVAFKMKVTYPDDYMVCPNSGFIEKGEMVNVAITLREDFNIKNKAHKFMVIATTVQGGEQAETLRRLGEMHPNLRIYKKKILVHLPKSDEALQEHEKVESPGTPSYMLEESITKTLARLERIELKLRGVHKDHLQLNEKVDYLRSKIIDESAEKTSPNLRNLCHNMMPNDRDNMVLHSFKGIFAGLGFCLAIAIFLQIISHMKQ